MKHRFYVVPMTAIAVGVGGVLLSGGFAASSASTRPPLPPVIKGVTTMEVLGHNGKVLLGKDGKPVRAVVGAVMPSMPPVAVSRAAQAQVNADNAPGAAPVEPVSVTADLRSQTDTQKAAVIGSARP